MVRASGDADHWPRMARVTVPHLARSQDRDRSKRGPTRTKAGGDPADTQGRHPMLRATFSSKFQVLLLALVLVGTLASAGVAGVGGGITSGAREVAAGVFDEAAGVEEAEAGGCYQLWLDFSRA